MKSEQILIEKKKNQTDSFFYPSYEPIATLESDDEKFVFDVRAVGDVDLNIGENNYSNSKSRMNLPNDCDELTDKQIHNDKAQWNNNNWFEVLAVKKAKLTSQKDDWIDLGSIVDSITYDYDEAIEKLKEVVEQYNKGEFKIEV